MRKLIFIDNDHQQRAEEEARSVQRKLSGFGNLPREYLESMKVIHSIYFLDKADLAKILFSPNQCICSFSMYTPNHYGSLYQLTEMLSKVGQTGIKDLFYIDCSGKMVEALEDELPIDKDKKNILSAFANNHIITLDRRTDDYKFVRLIAKSRKSKDSYFNIEDVDLCELLLK